jgi:hypothetical protein
VESTQRGRFARPGRGHHREVQERHEGSDLRHPRPLDGHVRSPHRRGGAGQKAVSSGEGERRAFAFSGSGDAGVSDPGKGEIRRNSGTADNGAPTFDVETTPVSEV